MNKTLKTVVNVAVLLLPLVVAALAGLGSAGLCGPYVRGVDYDHGQNCPSNICWY